MTSENALDQIDPLGLKLAESGHLDSADPSQNFEINSAESLFDFISGELIGDIDSVDNAESREMLAELGTTLRESGAPADSLKQPIRMGDALVGLRRLPFLTTRLEGAAPAWSTGLAAERRIGPITDRLGRNIWIDIYRRVRQLRFVRSPGGPPFLTLPIAQAKWAARASTLRAGQSLNIAAGSVWFATGLFSSAPANVYSGVRIARGTLRFSADLALNDDEVVVPASVSIEMALKLAAPAAPVPVAGSEFAATHFDPPQGLDIAIRPAGSSIAVRGPAKLGAWGEEVALAPINGAAQYRPDLHRLVLPMKPDRADFAIDTVASPLFVPSGKARIAVTGLALPAAVIAPADLGDASGVGALMLELKRGLSAKWQSQPHPVHLGPSLLLLDESRLAFTGHSVRATGSTARPELIRMSAPATLAYTQLNETAVHYLTGADGSESVAFAAEVDVRLPKPVDVAGNRVGVRLPAALVVIADSPVGVRTLMLIGLAPPQPHERAIAFALTNAVIRASRPRGFFLLGRIESDRIVEALALTAYELRGLLPSLPDPYAANSGLGQRFGAARQGYLLSHFHFNATDETLGFRLPAGVAVDPPLAGPGFATGQHAAASIELKSASAAAPPAYGDMFDFEKQPKIVLLDVSTNASRFGIAVRPPRASDRKSTAQYPLRPPQVQGLDLSIDGRFLTLLTLPAVQWEPVKALPGPEPFPDEVRFANSGVPTTVDVPSVDLVPINPLAAYRSIVDNFAQSNPRVSRARFTLPFGMLAQARLAPASPAGRGAQVGEVRPASADLEGAHQLRFEADDPTLPPGETPALPGFTAQLPVALPVNGDPPVSILGNSPTIIFNGYLGFGGVNPLVPVTRIDLSGHGESLFSAWANPDEHGVDVSKAEFQVLNGRAAHEVVQVRSFLLPYFIPVVRTITLERRGNAVFTREDSGWIAVRDGLYRASPASGVVTHPGVVQRATRVTNIRETGTAFPVSGIQFVAAYFDADLILDGAAAPVPARRQIGYIRLTPGIPDLTPALYAALIEAVGPMGGPIDASIAIGGGRQRMRLHRVGVGVAGPEFAMAAWGSLAFPGGGDWSILEADDAAEAPANVAADRGLPIIRQGAAGMPTAAAYRFADPEDLFDETSPQRDYGILHSMGTQRAFFRRPRIEAASPHRIVSSQRPVLADPLILATATGPFPLQSDAIPFPSAAFALEARPDGTWRLDAPATFPAAVPRRTIRTAGTVRSDIDYSGATVTYTLDTASPAPWRFKLQNAVKIMAHTAMGDLMSLAADVDAQAGRATSFADPKLKIGGPFDIVQDLMTILEDLGIPARPDVRMTNKWGLSVGLTIPFVDATGEDFKVIPGEPFPTIKFADTGIKIELAVAPEADEAVMELGGSPMFAIKSIPGLYVVAIIKFKLQLSTETGTTYGFLIGVGIAYSLEAGPFELKGLFAITFFAVFGDTVLGYGVGFLVKISAELPPIVAIEISLEGKLARLIAQKDLPDETVFQIAKLVFAIEVSIFLVFSISLEVETKKVEVVRGPLLESDAPDVL